MVNGGTRGMGRAAAEAWLEKGPGSRCWPGPKRLWMRRSRSSCRSGRPDAVGISTDLTSREAVDRAFASVGERWGGLKALVNAAGPVERGDRGIRSIDDDEWLATFDIGTLERGPLRTGGTATAAPGPWGRIVNISAHSTKRQSAELVAYTAAKAALTSLSKNLSASLAPDGILVNTVSPGSFLSEGLKGYFRALPPERGVDARAWSTPCG